MTWFIARSSIVAAFLAAAVGSASSSVAEEPNPASPADAPAMRVYRDPNTGELTSPPAAAARRGAAAAPAPQPLIVEPSAKGGVKIRLDERHRQTVRVTKDAAGKSKLDCERGVPAGQE
jgi:hypothetical protein